MCDDASKQDAFVGKSPTYSPLLDADIAIEENHRGFVFHDYLVLNISPEPRLSEAGAANPAAAVQDQKSKPTTDNR